MIIGSEISTGKKISIDLNKIIEGRMLIQANSGGGKSYAIRKFIEITHGKVQQIIIDVEGEFASLREKYDFVLVSKEGDIPISLKTADLLAKRLLELNVSAIIDLYELKHHERIKFVKLFFDSMINAPKELWHQCLVILDESHIFSPEKGSGEAESSEAVKDMATRGRKRGFSLVAATQRLSKLDKNVVAELNTKLIGRSSLDVDMKRSAYELGFTTKEDIFSLRNLDKGEFYAFGKGISDNVIKIKIDKVETKHVEAGSKYVQKPSSPTNKIKSLLSKLSDLPQEAEQELKTLQDYQKKIHELQVQIRTMARPQQSVDPEIILKTQQKAFNDGLSKGKELTETKYKDKIREIKQIFNNIIKNASEFPRTIDAIISKDGMDLVFQKPPIQITQMIQNITNPNLVKREAKTSINIDKGNLVTLSDNPTNKLRDGAMKMLKVIAMYHPDKTTKNRVATISGFTVGRGTFNTYLSELKRINWITINGNDLGITQEGLDNAGTFDMIPTDTESLLSLWCTKFRDGAAKMLRVIVESGGISKEDLGEKTGFTINGGTFNTYLSELRRNGLIEINDNMVNPSKEFFN